MIMNLKNIKKIHFVGIGGSGMSGLARIMKAQQKTVTGSDQNESHIIEALKREGIQVKTGHSPKNIPTGTEMVVYSPAVPRTNPERMEAKKRGVAQYSYPQAVGLLTETKKTVCICGTHGKTTTTAMASAVFMNDGKDPSVIVGANIRELHNRNAHNGQGGDLIIESCEYRRGFLNYSPQTIIITNVEADHLDYYKNLLDYKKAFRQFLDKLPENGMAIVNGDDKNIESIIRKYKSAKIVTYGKSASSDYMLKKNTVYHGGKKIAELRLSIPGEHNLMNATAVIALASEYGMALQPAVEALNRYKGSSRRFETVGYHNKAVVIDDYGHHPTEIKATLKAARERFGKKAKILCIFQPHQFSRTQKLLKDFVKAFTDADEVIIPNIYGVRDSAADRKKINTQKLVAAISKHHGKVRDGQGMEATTLSILQNNTYDVVITMGAGDVYKISEALISTPSSR